MIGALKVALLIATGAAASAAICIPVPAAAASTSSIAGAWQGPFVGTTFIFEFTPKGNGWVGRYQDEKYGKWRDLQSVSFSDGVVRFSFESKPPSSFTFKLDAKAKALNGSVQFGTFKAIPLTLTPRSK